MRIMAAVFLFLPRSVCHKLGRLVKKNVVLPHELLLYNVKHIRRVRRLQARSTRGTRAPAVGPASVATLIANTARTKELVPKRGLEPPHPDGYYTLNVARLPIPPLRHAKRFVCQNRAPGKGLFAVPLCCHPQKSLSSRRIAQSKM